jgi:hypothetical protein
LEVNNPSANEEQQIPEKPQMKIVGYNLLAVLGYGIISVIPGDGIGLLFYALMIVLHFLFCLCAAIYNRNWMWVLSAFLVLIVGFSTCAGAANLFNSRGFE